MSKKNKIRKINYIKKSLPSLQTRGFSLVVLPGFEPRQTESKSVVLPLHHNPIQTELYFGLQK